MVIKTKCDCCGNVTATYIRKFNSNMSICLIALVKNNMTGFVKIEDFLLEKGYKRCGDFSYLRHYGLLQAMDGKRNDDSKRTGYYKITGRGIAFANNALTVPEKFIIRDNTFLGHDGKEVNIEHTLGTKFNYRNLISE